MFCANSILLSVFEKSCASLEMRWVSAYRQLSTRCYTHIVSRAAFTEFESGFSALVDDFTKIRADQAIYVDFVDGCRRIFDQYVVLKKPQGHKYNKSEQRGR